MIRRLCFTIAHRPRVAAAPVPERRRALTLIEMLVAMALAGIFFSSAIASFLMILRSSRDVEVQTNAVSNARAALDNLTMDLKQASGPSFVGTTLPLDRGDLQNPALAEEKEYPPPLDFTPADLNRASLSTTQAALVERPEQGTPGHFGDKRVDVNPVFHNDTIEFRVSPLNSAPYQVLYEIKDFEVPRSDALPTVLTRTVTFLTSTTVVPPSPVAYDVLSFRCLFWDPVHTPTPDWIEKWPGGDPPKSVLLEITVYADPNPIENYRPLDLKPVRTVTLRTIVNPAPSDPSGLVAHWRFNDKDSLIAGDSSGNNHALALATNMDPATAWPPGYLGDSLKFDGSSGYAQTTADADLLAAKNDLTIAFWVRPAASQQAGATILDANHLANGGQNYAIVQSATGGPNSYAFVYQSGGTTVGDTPLSSLFTTLTADTWQHFAVVKIGTTLMHYRNGRAIGSLSPVPNSLANASAPIRVGASMGTGGHFGGQIDDMRIYNRALLPGEIEALAH